MSTIKELKTLGAFVSDEPIKRTIKFKLDDEQELSAEIFVKKLSVGDYEKLFAVVPDDQSRTAKLISETIRLGEGGKEKISFVDAYKLHTGIATAIIEAFNEVNGAKAKN